MASKRNNITTIVIDLKPWQIGTGHTSRKGGAGLHKDRRTKRLRTRSSQKRNALREWN